MKGYILLVALILAFVEWYVIRRTSINRWIPLIIILIFALPIAFQLGAHLVGLPILLPILVLALCEIEDQLKKRLLKQPSEMQKTKIKDL